MRRLPKKIYIALPTKEDRKNILKKRLHTLNSLKDDVVDQISETTRGFSGSDLVSFCNEVLLQPMRKFVHGSSFVLIRDNENNIQSIELYTEKTEQTGERVNCDFFTLANTYDESLLKQPEPDNLEILTTLASFRQNVCEVDVSKYESFLK